MVDDVRNIERQTPRRNQITAGGAAEWGTVAFPDERRGYADAKNNIGVIAIARKYGYPFP
jgi:hypothetical protein